MVAWYDTDALSGSHISQSMCVLYVFTRFPCT